MEKKDSVTTARKRGTAVPEELPESRDKRSEIIKAAPECFFEKGRGRGRIVLLLF